MADAADILKRGSEDGLNTWVTIGRASGSVVERLAARIGKNCPAVPGGDETAGLFGDAGQAIAEEKGGRRALRSTAAKGPA